MKFNLISAKRLIALLIVSTALVGCGSGGDDGANAPGTPGAPGYNPGTVVQTPGGGMQISFSGSDNYVSSNYVTGGYAGKSQYCGWFYYGGSYLQQNCWMFSNYSFHNGGQLFVGGGGLPFMSGGTLNYNGTSLWEAGASITIVTTQPINTRAAVSGSIVVPPSFITRNPQAFPQGSGTPIIGIAIDMTVSPSNGYNQYNPYQYGGTYSVSGGVLIYTSGSQQQGYGGAFLRI